jgi:uncharacterized protein (DUF2236 family)
LIDEGYFPRGRSVLRRVHGERIVGLIYGQRALLLGAVHPLNYVGTVISTRSGIAPFSRLAHTGKIFETVFFGTREEADRALASVHTLHERVQGVLPQDAGKWPAGSEYSAYDPDLMLWTVAVMFDSAEVLYDTLVRRLSDEEREALWREYVLFGELFGMPRETAPVSHAAFRDYWQDCWTGDDLHLTAGARESARRIAFEIPVPLRLAGGMEAVNLLLLGTLPAAVRERYGLPWGPMREVAFRSVAAGLRGSRSFLPNAVRRGGNDAVFDLVARTERDRVRRGRAPLELSP